MITDIVRREIRSYRQLPVNFYQIQTKFRDEIRPRFGVMRAREFVMKDAYSFDADEAGMLRSYRIMYDAYARIFTRLGLQFRAVDADTGAIGGALSHEFQVLADSGEDAIAYSNGSDYAANVEKAEALAPAPSRPRRPKRWTRVPTPGKSTCEEVAELLQLPLARTVKCLMVWADGRVHMLLVRGDHMGNEVKIGKLPGMDGWRWASDAEIIEATGCKPGYLGPVGIPKEMPLIVDRAVAAMADFVCGANEAGLPPARRQLRPRLPRTGRSSPTSATSSKATRRRTARARSTSCAASRSAMCSRWAPCIRRRWAQLISTPSGQAKVMEMGCYGIGVHPHRGGRHRAEPRRARHHLAAAAGPVRRGHRAHRLRPQRSACKALADKLHDELEAAGVEVLLDDRGERPGVMFADLELIGIPHRITIGDRGLEGRQGRIPGAPRDGGHARAGGGHRRVRPRPPCLNDAARIEQNDRQAA